MNYLYFCSRFEKSSQMKKEILTFLSIIVFAFNITAQVQVEISTEISEVGGNKYYLHFVKPGQTLYSISRAYDVSIGTILDVNENIENGLSVGQILKVPFSDEIEAQAQQNIVVHVVEEGETLYSLFRKYEIEPDVFYRHNPEVKYSPILSVGQQLLFPVDRAEDEIDLAKIEEETKDTVNFIYHIFERGETVFSLSRKYKISTGKIAQVNPGLDMHNISIGQEIKIPRLFPEQELNQYAEMEKPVDKEERDTVRFKYHVFQAGETVYSVSVRYGIPQERIISANPEIDINALSIGQEIRIPRPEGFTNYEKQRLIDSLARMNFEFQRPMPLPDEKIIADIIRISCDSLELKISKRNINIAVLLPFDAKSNLEQLNLQAKQYRDLQLNQVSESVTNFYYGCLVALGEFKNKDVKINFNVFDVGRSTVELEKLIKSGKIQNMDFIIGPAFGSQINYLAENINSDNTKIILPFSRDDSILERYNNLFMVRTPTYFQNKAIVDYALKNPDKNYLIVKRKIDENDFQLGRYLMENHFEFEYNIDTLIRTLEFDGTKIIGLENALHSNKENVVILTFNGEYEVFRIFTQLFPVENALISVIGDQSIINYETIDPNFFRKNNFTYYSSINVDYSDYYVKEFILQYRDVFNSEPDVYSFLGYDIVKYFVYGLIYYDEMLSQCLTNGNVLTGLSGEIIFSKTNFFRNNSFSNKKIYLYKLNKNFGFDIIYPDKFVFK